MHSRGRSPLNIISCVNVRAPSRIHFGLLPAAGNHTHRRGGLGVMIESPCLELRLHKGVDRNSDRTSDPRINQLVAAYASHWAIDTSDIEIEVVDAPTSHIGLGSGTQIAMSVGAMLSAFSKDRPASAQAIASAMGRGSRSLVGSVGFERGGLVWDAGSKGESSETAIKKNMPDAVQAFSFPEDWCFVLLWERNQQGLSGKKELKAFSQIPSNPAERIQLIDHVDNYLLPALFRDDLNSFGEGLYEYGMRCGCMFERHQMGSFATTWVTNTVAQLRRDGVRGVGQSSWGPTVFGLFGSQMDAETFIESASWLNNSVCHCAIAPVATQGAQLSIGYEDR